jgi:hypothetical protein
MPSFFIPWHKIPLTPPPKMNIKVIYSHGIKAFGKKYLLPVYVWTFFNRNNQTFTKLRNILKEYFLKPRIGF